jgi:glycosyltransferase involved in cell wall biosynthesis
MGLDEVANMTVSVSVVIPTHNSQATIERALTSVYSQTVAPTEIIVIDDCSSDETRKVVKDISDLAPVKTYLFELDQNLGPSYARNHGWDRATSDYVAFLDSDDSWHPQKLEIQYRWMTQHPEVVISGHLTGHSSERFSSQNITVNHFTYGQFLVRNRVSTPTVMLKRVVPQRFNSERWYAEDYELWLNILSTTPAIARLELPLTALHKATFGGSGLSGKLASMYLGEIQVASQQRQERRISLGSWLAIDAWITSKFLVRLVRVLLRRNR